MSDDFKSVNVSDVMHLPHLRDLLASEIRGVYKSMGVNQASFAKLVGSDVPKVSMLLKGDLDRIPFIAVFQMALKAGVRLRVSVVPK